MKMTNENPDEMSEENTYFWIVSLVAGDPEEGGFVAEQRLVTKKWERVEALVDHWQEFIDSGEYYAQVQAMRSVAQAHFSKS